MSPFAGSDCSYRVFFVGSIGDVDNGYASNAEGVRPSVYLSSNVIVLSGDGSENEPYTLEAPLFTNGYNTRVFVIYFKGKY